MPVRKIGVYCIFYILRKSEGGRRGEGGYFHKHQTLPFRLRGKGGNVFLHLSYYRGNERGLLPTKLREGKENSIFSFIYKKRGESELPTITIVAGESYPHFSRKEK